MKNNTVIASEAKVVIARSSLRAYPRSNPASIPAKQPSANNAKVVIASEAKHPPLTPEESLSLTLGAFALAMLAVSAAILALPRSAYDNRCAYCALGTARATLDFAPRPCAFAAFHAGSNPMPWCLVALWWLLLPVAPRIARILIGTADDFRKADARGKTMIAAGISCLLAASAIAYLKPSSGGGGEEERETTEERAAQGGEGAESSGRQGGEEPEFPEDDGYVPEEEFIGHGIIDEIMDFLGYSGIEGAYRQESATTNAAHWVEYSPSEALIAWERYPMETATEQLTLPLSPGMIVLGDETYINGILRHDGAIAFGDEGAEAPRLLQPFHGPLYLDPAKGAKVWALYTTNSVVVTWEDMTVLPTNAFPHTVSAQCEIYDDATIKMRYRLAAPLSDSRFTAGATFGTNTVNWIDANALAGGLEIAFEPASAAWALTRCSASDGIHDFAKIKLGYDKNTPIDVFAPSPSGIPGRQIYDDIVEAFARPPTRAPGDPVTYTVDACYETGVPANSKMVVIAGSANIELIPGRTTNVTVTTEIGAVSKIYYHKEKSVNPKLPQAHYTFNLPTNSHPALVKDDMAIVCKTIGDSIIPSYLSATSLLSFVEFTHTNQVCVHPEGPVRIVTMYGNPRPEFGTFKWNAEDPRNILVSAPHKDSVKIKAVTTNNAETVLIATYDAKSPAKVLGNIFPKRIPVIVCATNDHAYPASPVAYCEANAHVWNGCRCTKCPEERHDHQSPWCTCLRCGIVVYDCHDFDGTCMCRVCGKRHDFKHRDDLGCCLCAICGEVGFPCVHGGDDIQRGLPHRWLKHPSEDYGKSGTLSEIIPYPRGPACDCEEHANVHVQHPAILDALSGVRLYGQSDRTEEARTGNVIKNDTTYWIEAIAPPSATVGDKHLALTVGDDALTNLFTAMRVDAVADYDNDGAIGPGDLFAHAFSLLARYYAGGTNAFLVRLHMEGAVPGGRHAVALDAPAGTVLRINGVAIPPGATNAVTSPPPGGAIDIAATLRVPAPGTGTVKFRFEDGLPLVGFPHGLPRHSDTLYFEAHKVVAENIHEGDALAAINPSAVFHSGQARLSIEAPSNLP
ncbi:MAG: hypothetical protein FWF84_04385, partial [Kiritimatiellaeota bacterium]|nr:hypothetical protein [Kiritimatiellota bacterium]